MQGKYKTHKVNTRHIQSTQGKYKAHIRHTQRTDTINTKPYGIYKMNDLQSVYNIGDQYERDCLFS